MEWLDPQPLCCQWKGRHKASGGQPSPIELMPMIPSSCAQKPPGTSDNTTVTATWSPNILRVTTGDGIHGERQVAAKMAGNLVPKPLEKIRIADALSQNGNSRTYTLPMSSAFMYLTFHADFVALHDSQISWTWPSRRRRRLLFLSSCNFFCLFL